MQAISGIAFGLVAGVIGWTVAEFFGKPFRRGVDLVAQARMEAIRYGNVSGVTYEGRPAKESDDLPLSEDELDRLKAAQDKFRELGATLQAFLRTERLATWALTLTGLRLHDAGVAFIGLSNTSHEYGSRRAEFSARIERSLCFKI